MLLPCHETGAPDQTTFSDLGDASHQEKKIEKDRMNSGVTTSLKEARMDR